MSEKRPSEATSATAPKPMPGSGKGERREREITPEEAKRTGALVREVLEEFGARVKRRKGVLEVEIPGEGAPAQVDEEAETEPDPEADPETEAEIDSEAEPDADGDAEPADDGDDEPADVAPDAEGDDDAEVASPIEGPPIAPPTPSAVHRTAGFVRDELARDLGGSRALKLCFHEDDLEPGCDLVGPGSFVLTGIDRFLRGRGRRAILEAPKKHRASRPKVLRALGLADADVEEIERSAGHRLEAFFVFKVGPDDHALPQELVCVRTLAGGGEVRVSDRLPLKRLASFEDRPRRRFPRNAIEPLWEAALGTVEAEARARVAPLERTVLEGVRRDLARVDAFYRAGFEQLKRGSRDPYGAKAKELETEMRRKIAELLEGRAIRVVVEAVQLLLVERPTTRYEIALRGGARVEAAIDLHDGTVIGPPCASCEVILLAAPPSKAKASSRRRTAGPAPALCEAGHLCCAACADPCRACR